MPTVSAVRLDPEMSVTDLARLLLGAMLRTDLPDGTTAVRITEVEAYGGEDDPASHAWRGRNHTNGSMFLSAGHAYTYRSHGLHVCFNIVTGRVGEPSAVLVRAGEPQQGAEVMERRRERADHLCDGPGKLCQALGITMAHDGHDLRTGPIRLLAGVPPRRVDELPRVGISRATDRLWRFRAGER